MANLARLTKRSEFLFVRDGRYQAIGAIVIQMRNNPIEENAIRVGFTATKKIGKAVIRNKAKRRLRAIAHQLLPVLGKPGHDYVFIARRGTATRPFEKLMSDAKKALKNLT